MSTKDKNPFIITLIISLVFCIAIVVGLVVFVNQIPPPIDPPPTQEEEEQPDDDDNSDNDSNDNNNDNNNDNDSNNNDNEPIVPTLSVPESLNIDLLNTNFVFSYTTNLEDYVTVSISDTSVATINTSNIITPIKVGTTKIITRINTTPEIIKETTLNILDCVSEIAMQITSENGTDVPVYYTDTNYILKISQNYVDSSAPQIVTETQTIPLAPYIATSNIKEITYIKTENNCLYYKFKINNFGNFTFLYQHKYVNSSLANSAYIKPTNFDVDFSRNVTNNTISLYLFNNDYLAEANNDGYYNEITYTVTAEQNTNDKIVVLLDNNIVNTSHANDILTLANNTLTAKSIGTSTLKFISEISGVIKEFTINISTINLSSILINNTPKSLNLVENESIDKTTGYPFKYAPYPIYSICDLSINYNSDEITYTNNTLFLNDECLNSVVTIKNFDQTIYTLNISMLSEIIYELNITQKYCDVDLENNTITATLNGDKMFQLNCTAYNSSTKENLKVQNYLVSVENSAICRVMSDITSSGNIDILIEKEGSTTITIQDLENNQTINLTIVVKAP